MPYEFKSKRMVEFADTDTAGMMHFANFFRYMEEVEHAFYRSLGFSVHMPSGDQWIGWPRVQAACEYRSPLHFEDEVEIHLLVRERRSKSIAYSFLFSKLNDDMAKDVARGSMTVVCVGLGQEQDSIKARAIPPQIAVKIEAAPRELLSE